MAEAGIKSKSSLNSTEPLAIEVENLSMQFGDFRAVDNLSFTMRKNEAVGIIGPNGAGKTTFVNLLTGDFPPTTGTIKLFGKDVTNVPTQKRVESGVLRSFQLVQVFDNLTVQQNIALAYYRKVQGPRSLATSFFQKLSNKQYKEKVDEIRELFGFAGVENTYVSALSLGNKKKLEIAMSYITDPELMILDEPFSGLGDQDIDSFIQVLKSWVHKKTLLIVEHKLSKLTSIVDELAVLHEGRLIAYGPCEETLNDPEVRRSYWKITEPDKQEKSNDK
ncbi:MAG: ATP-binding cassette domain-containing protein [Spirochaetaceae bacterium]|nr:ATP-binding cassette domain-containing protein [Spirochaetaceae bacterium]